MFKIEKGGANDGTLPHGSGRASGRTCWDQMEVGDSVQLESQTQATSIRNTAKRMGLLVRCQQQEDEFSGAWRIE